MSMTQGSQRLLSSVSEEAHTTMNLHNLNGLLSAAD